METLSAAVVVWMVVSTGTDNRRRTFLVSGRAQRVGKKGYGPPKDSRAQDNLIRGPTGSVPQRSAAVNPTFRHPPTRQQGSQSTGSCGGTPSRPGLTTRPSPADDGAADGTAPMFVPGMRVDMRGFLQAILSQENFEKYRGILEQTPKKG